MMCLVKYLWLKYFLALLYLSVIEENIMIEYLITIRGSSPLDYIHFFYVLFTDE